MYLYSLFENMKLFYTIECEKVFNPLIQVNGLEEPFFIGYLKNKNKEEGIINVHNMNKGSEKEIKAFTLPIKYFKFNFKGNYIACCDIHGKLIKVFDTQSGNIV